MSTNYVIKDMELKVLLAAAGVERLCGFSGSTAAEESCVPYLVHEMVRNGLVRQENDSLFIASPYKEMIDGIKNANSILIFMPEENTAIPTSVYLGRTCIVIQDSPNDKDAVRMWMADVTDIMKLLTVYDADVADRHYPEDLACPPLEEESGRKIAVITLQGMFGEGNEAMKVQWSLYEGRYRRYAEKEYDDVKERMESDKRIWKDIEETIQRVLEVR